MGNYPYADGIAKLVHIFSNTIGGHEIPLKPLPLPPYII
jgi:hypothetical protein